MTKTLNNNYKSSTLKDGWKYRYFGTTILGINEDCNQIKTISFATFSEMKKEFNKLTSRPVGRKPLTRRRVATRPTPVSARY